MDLHYGGCVFVCGRDRRARGAWTANAKLPMKRRASGGFKQAPTCNMDETGAPCRTVWGPKACSGLTVSLSMFLIDFTLWGVLARWSFLFVGPWLYHGSAHLPSVLLHLSLLSPSSSPPLASLWTATTYQALTFTAVFHITSEHPSVLRRSKQTTIDIWQPTRAYSSSCIKTLKHSLI